jgi:hypothetical protein
MDAPLGEVDWPSLSSVRVARENIPLELRSRDIRPSPVLLYEDRSLVDAVVKLSATHAKNPGGLPYGESQTRQVLARGIHETSDRAHACSQFGCFSRRGCSSIPEPGGQGNRHFCSICVISQGRRLPDERRRLPRTTSAVRDLPTSHACRDRF